MMLSFQNIPWSVQAHKQIYLQIDFFCINIDCCNVHDVVKGSLHILKQLFKV